jgi:hypothetical protein
MPKFYTKKDIDYSLNNYTFKCQKNRYDDGNYIKKYIFDIPKHIYDMFSPYTSKFRLNSDCHNAIVINLSTRIEKKTNKIIPIINCEKGIKLSPGNSIVNDIDEAKELLTVIYIYLEKKFTQIKHRKHESDCGGVRNVINGIINDKINDTIDIKNLKKKHSKITIQLENIQNKITNEHTKIVDNETWLVCNEIKENNYIIPEEDVERILCQTKYFEKSAIIQVITERILNIEEKRKR